MGATMRCIRGLWRAFTTKWCNWQQGGGGWRSLAFLRLGSRSWLTTVILSTRGAASTAAGSVTQDPLVAIHPRHKARIVGADADDVEDASTQFLPRRGFHRTLEASLYAYDGQGVDSSFLHVLTIADYGSRLY